MPCSHVAPPSMFEMQPDVPFVSLLFKMMLGRQWARVKANVGHAINTLLQILSACKIYIAPHESSTGLRARTGSSALARDRDGDVVRQVRRLASSVRMTAG